MPKLSLTTRRPAEGAIEFTVSTRQSRAPTLLNRTAHYLLGLGRTVIAITTLLSLFVRWYSWAELEGISLPFAGAAYSPLSDAVRLAEGLIQSATGSSVHTLPWTYHLILSLVLLWLSTRRFYTEESLLVLHGLGVQTTTSAPYYLSSPTVQFIPTSSIQDIFIHEAFKGFEVRFYLSIVVRDEPDVVVVFPTILPRRAILEEVWRSTRKCLYG